MATPKPATQERTTSDESGPKDPDQKTRPLTTTSQSDSEHPSRAAGQGQKPRSVKTPKKIRHDEDQTQKNDKKSAHGIPTGLELTQLQIIPMAKKPRKAPSQEELETASGGLLLGGLHGGPSHPYEPREDQICHDHSTRPEGCTNPVWFKKSE